MLDEKIEMMEAGVENAKEEIQEKMPNASIIETSMLQRLGVTEIEEEIVDMVYSGNVKQNDSVMVTNVRHKELLEKAYNSLNDAYNMACIREAMDFIELDIKAAYDFLGEITGETVSDDIINEVFARFCLGK
jgi:tRNA modification GTPase